MSDREPKRLLALDEQLPATARDDDEDAVDECPNGGWHEPMEIRSAMQREPLVVTCSKCRQVLVKET